MLDLFFEFFFFLHFSTYQFWGGQTDCFELLILNRLWEEREKKERKVVLVLLVVVFLSLLFVVMPCCSCFPKYEPETQANKDLVSNHYAPAIPPVASNNSTASAAYKPSSKVSSNIEKANREHAKKAKKALQQIHITEEHQECAVCYDDLCSHRTAVFVKRDGKTRTCKHYFHASCAREVLEHAEQEMKINQQGELEEEEEEDGQEEVQGENSTRVANGIRNNNNSEEEDEGASRRGGIQSINNDENNKRNRISATCPICRVPVYGVVNVPSCSTNPNLWFDMVDIDNDGKVSPTDLVTILRAQFLVDWRTIEKKLTGEIWPKYDVNNEGFISRDELLKPDGLLDYLLKTFETPKRRFRNCPNLEMQPKKWFEYWDEDHSGTLDSEELIRALVKTFNLNAELRCLRAMAESVRAVWGAFDQDDKGEISLDEFIAPEGLAQSIVATMRWSDSVPSSREHSRMSGQDGSDLRISHHSSDAKSAGKTKRVGILGFSRLRGSADERDIPDSPRDQRLAFLNTFRTTTNSSEDIA